MTLLPLEIPPGIVRTRSENAAKGRFTGGDHIRFVNGLPEKWKGWRKLISGQTALLGMARGAVGWSNQYGNPNAAFGTNIKLYALLGNDTLQDITPVRASSTINNNPFATTSGSPTVTVTDTSHGAGEGDYVTFSGAAAVAGITINGEYSIVSVTDANTYTITHSSNANATTSGGGASVTAAYQISVGLADTVAGLGWGAGAWGEGTWSTPRTSGIDLEFRFYSLSEYGNDLLANPSTLGLYLWEEATDARAEIVSNAPTQIRAMFVTGERYIFALGSLDVGPMTVKWPDRDDLTDWTPSASNTANSRTLQSGSKLMSGCALTDGISLVWSDTSLYIFQYTGDEFVYSDRLAGTNCGLAGPLAFCKAAGTAFWFSGRMLWMYAGGPVPIPNVDDQLDAMLEEMDPAQISKTWLEFDQFNHQIRVHYCALNSSEPDRYIDVNLPGATGPTVDDWAWTNGTWPTVARTTGCIFRPDNGASILVGDDGLLYSHNDGLDDHTDALDWSLTWGLYALSRGEQTVDVMGIVPDTERQTGSVTYTVFTKDRPNDADNLDEADYTAAATDGIVDARISGRHFSMTAAQSDIVGGDVRFGVVNLEVQDAGERR